MYHINILDFNIIKLNKRSTHITEQILRPEK